MAALKNEAVEVAGTADHLNPEVAAIRDRVRGFPTRTQQS